MIRSYRADSGKVLGDDMGVPGPHYRHAYSLCRERQGQFVSYNFFVSSTTTFGTSILATIMYKTVVECWILLLYLTQNYKTDTTVRYTTHGHKISLAYI